MKIAIPSTGTDIKSDVNQSFGRTPYFIVVDSDTKDFKVIDNKAADAQGGAGIKAAQTIVDSGAQAVITFRCGQNVADVLNTAGIKMIQAQSGSVEDMIAKFNKGELKELAEIHPGYHNHGGA